MKDTDEMERIIREHPFFAGFDESFLRVVCGCARNVRFAEGEYLFEEGGTADRFYLLRHGRAALEVKAPGHGAISFHTLSAGDIVGLSWLIPPYRWTYDARALDPVRAISLDAVCVRRKCEEDHDLGYEMMKRVVPVLSRRLQDTRLQILDVYGSAA